MTCTHFHLWRGINVTCILIKGNLSFSFQRLLAWLITTLETKTLLLCGFMFQNFITWDKMTPATLLLRSCFLFVEFCTKMKKLVFAKEVKKRWSLMDSAVWWTVQSDENKDQYIYTLPWRWNERLSIFIYLLVVIYFKVKKKKILYMWNGSNIWIEEFLVPKSSTKECFLFTTINSANFW